MYHIRTHTCVCILGVRIFCVYPYFSEREEAAAGAAAMVWRRLVLQRRLSLDESDKWTRTENEKECGVARRGSRREEAQKKKNCSVDEKGLVERAFPSGGAARRRWVLVPRADLHFRKKGLGKLKEQKRVLNNESEGIVFNSLKWPTPICGAVIGRRSALVAGDYTLFFSFL